MMFLVTLELVKKCGWAVTNNIIVLSVQIYHVESGAHNEHYALLVESIGIYSA